MSETLEQMAESAAIEHGFAVVSPGMPTLVSMESLEMFKAGYRAALPETTAEEGE